MSSREGLKTLNVLLMSVVPGSNSISIETGVSWIALPAAAVHGKFKTNAVRRKNKALKRIVKRFRLYIYNRLYKATCLGARGRLQAVVANCVPVNLITV